MDEIRSGTELAGLLPDWVEWGTPNGNCMIIQIKENIGFPLYHVALGEFEHLNDKTIEIAINYLRYELRKNLEKEING